MKKIEKTIETDKWYGIGDLTRLSKIGLFPVRSKISIKRLFQSGKLQGIDVGTKTLQQWRIRGDAIINFVNGDRNRGNKENV